MKQASEPNRSINIAILAMGGEGGGVLADWIVDLAEDAGYCAQATSVPGVAQRTGATIYYVEMLEPGSDARQPVMALMPFPGDVDVVIASELMEAGRAVQRGFVTPDRTTFIASTHRVYSMTERTAMGEGRVDGDKLLEAGRAAAQQFVAADFARAAEEQGSLISAVLFGALCGSGRLPFARESFVQAIRRGGVGVEASIRAFDEGLRLAKSPQRSQMANPEKASEVGARLQALGARIQKQFPEAAHPVLRIGIQRLADYQDLKYAAEYLELLLPVRDLELRAGDGQGLLLRETARYLALWMSYEDTIRVADLKTRRQRFARVRGEAKVQDNQVLEINEFLHPRIEEIADTLPASMGRWLLRTGWARALAGRFTREGRTVKTSSLRGFLLLYLIASLRRMRRYTLRYHVERQRIGIWLARIREVADRDYDLAVAIAQCQRLVKGYSDTHARGVHSFDAIMGILPSLDGREGAGALLRTLRDAALADESGGKLRQSLAEVVS
ncbi:MAG: indolepyruvate oxidoreductase subunit beta family protein [Burkholderiales bacterium]